MFICIYYRKFGPITFEYTTLNSHTRLLILLKQVGLTSFLVLYVCQRNTWPIHFILFIFQCAYYVRMYVFMMVALQADLRYSYLNVCGPFTQSFSVGNTIMISFPLFFYLRVSYICMYLLWVYCRKRNCSMLHALVTCPKWSHVWMKDVISIG